MITTFTLVMMLNTYSPVVVSGFGTIEQCQQAYLEIKREFEKSSKVGSFYHGGMVVTPNYSCIKVVSPK